LPGVFNTRFHLARFADALEQCGFDVELRPWGAPLRPLRNLAAHEHNVGTATRIAGDLARWRIDHPHEALYVVGYSGGGGLAVLAVSALPENVAVDRLILVAPAISPKYPVATDVLPHVREFVVNYASSKDLQVGWGTEMFGTIDRERTKSAGATGFHLAHSKLLQWQWSKASMAYGHYGNHLSFLAYRWQAAALLPALDPVMDARALAARWARMDAQNGHHNRDRA
jgi:pimeloyl-ACP methyl ester carboxylesterase